MSKAELVKKLKKLALSKDPEEAHSAADDLLLEFINDAEVTTAFEEVPKWYA